MEPEPADDNQAILRAFELRTIEIPDDHPNAEFLRSCLMPAEEAKEFLRGLGAAIMRRP